MKTLTTFIWAGALALLAQPNQLDLRQDPPTAVQSERVSSAYTGASGATTYYYWVVTRYPVGFIVPTSPVVVGGASALGGGNSVALGWPAMTGASSYDVLRTTTNAAPSSCTCAVVLATTGTTLTDNGGALSAWPPGGLNSAGVAQAELQINNRDAGSPYITMAVRNAQRILNYQLGILKNGAAPSYVPSGFIQPYSNPQGALACVDSTGADCMATRPGPTNFCSDAGSTDAYACSLSPAITAYVVGNSYRFKANTANSGAATIDFGPGAVAIKKAVGSVTTALATGDIRAGQVVDVAYDANGNMQMQSAPGNGFDASGNLTVPGILSVSTKLSSKYLPYDIVAAGADPSLSDNSSIIQTALATGYARIPAGIYNVAAPLTVTDTALTLLCDPGAVLKATAALTTALLTFTGSSNHSLSISKECAFDMTDKASLPALVVDHANPSTISGTFTSGTYGVYVTVSGLIQFKDLRFINQSVAMIYYQADAGAETKFLDILGTKNDTGTLPDGIAVIRTTATDVGGLDFTRVKLVASNGNGSRMTYGLRISASVLAGMPFNLTGSAMDGVDYGVHLTNLNGGVFATDNWISVRGDSTGQPVVLDNVHEVNWSGGRIASESTGTTGCILASNGSSILQIQDVEAINGWLLRFGAGSPPATNILIGSIMLAGTNPALSSDDAVLAANIATEKLFGKRLYSPVVASGPVTFTDSGVWGKRNGDVLQLGGYSGVEIVRGTADSPGAQTVWIDAATGVPSFPYYFACAAGQTATLYASGTGGQLLRGPCVEGAPNGSAPAVVSYTFTKVATGGACTEGTAGYGCIRVTGIATDLPATDTTTMDIPYLAAPAKAWLSGNISITTGAGDCSTGITTATVTDLGVTGTPDYFKSGLTHDLKTGATFSNVTPTTLGNNTAAANNWTARVTVASETVRALPVGCTWTISVPWTVRP